MKTINKIGYAVIIGAGLFVCTTAKSQTLRANESLAKQLIDGTAPGLQFAPSAPKKQSETVKPKEYTQGNYMSILFTGWNPSAGSTARTTNAKAMLSKSTSSPLASEGKIPDAAPQKMEIPKQPPMQKGDKK